MEQIREKESEREACPKRRSVGIYVTTSEFFFFTARGQNRSHFDWPRTRRMDGERGKHRNKYLHGESKDGKDLYKLLEC